jgi:hypothetical protein
MIIMSFDENKTLKVKWSKKENDWFIHYPSKATGHMISNFLDSKNMCFPEFIEELRSRGYDTRTLKITVNRRQFKCIQNYVTKDKSYIVDKTYYLSSEDKDRLQIVNEQGFLTTFSKNKLDKEYVYNYFTEIFY